MQKPKTGQSKIRSRGQGPSMQRAVHTPIAQFQILPFMRHSLQTRTFRRYKSVFYVRSRSLSETALNNAQSVFLRNAKEKQCFYLSARHKTRPERDGNCSVATFRNDVQPSKQYGRYFDLSHRRGMPAWHGLTRSGRRMRHMCPLLQAEYKITVTYAISDAFEP